MDLLDRDVQSFLFVGSAFPLLPMEAGHHEASKKLWGPLPFPSGARGGSLVLGFLSIKPKGTRWLKLVGGEMSLEHTASPCGQKALGEGAISHPDISHLLRDSFDLSS